MTQKLVVPFWKSLWPLPGPAPGCEAEVAQACRYREGPSGSGTVRVSGVPTICHFPGSQETPEGNTTSRASKSKTQSPLFTQETTVSANLEPKNWSHRGGSGRGHSTQQYWTLQGELPTQAGPTVPPGCLSLRGLRGSEQILPLPLQQRGSLGPQAAWNQLHSAQPSRILGGGGHLGCF